MHILTVDQGNTRTKLGLFADDVLLSTWAVPTVKQATATELGDAVLLPTIPSRIVLGLCTVVPELIGAWQALAAQRAYPLTLISGSIPTPLASRYATPETLGADRLMAAVAAVAAVGTPVIPVSLGTATVVDAVSADHAYLGGMIAPGIGTMARALSSAASALHDVPWRIPAYAIGRTTEDALTAGWFHQALGGLRAMIHATRDALGTEAPLALTGGWAARLADHLDGVALIDEALVLRGIALTVRHAE